MKKNIKSQSGVGLLEIMVSLLIGSILILAITSMYGNFIGTSKMQQEQSAVQDQANFAFLELNRAVRMAGAGLCVNPMVDAATRTHQPSPFDSFPPLLSSEAIFGAASRLHSYTNPTASQLGTTLTPANSSDALLVIYSDPATMRISGIETTTAQQESSRFHARRLATPRSQPTAANPNGADPVFNYDSGYAPQTTWVMISDCEHTGILKYSGNTLDAEKNVNILPVPDNGNFAYNFGAGNQEVLLGKLHAKLFFVATSSDGVSQLYVKNLLSPNTNPQPLAPFITKMQVEYQNPTTQVWGGSASRTDNWEEEWPVRITLTTNAGRQLGDQTFTRILNIRN